VSVLWGSLAGAALGTVVLTTGLRLAQEVGWTRMDIPLLLGTAFSGDRRHAAVIGYAIHFLNGLLFALLYAAVFLAVDAPSWWLGAVLGLVHAAFAGGALVSVLLPAVHPRMGSISTDAEESPLLEPPGFMLENYGRRTVWVTVALHVVYGALIGGFAAWAA
jgi:hypothetical protein